MKLKITFLFLVLGSYIYPQTSPAKIDLTSKSHKLDAKFYSGGNKSAPAIILLHGFPGNQISPLDLAEHLSIKGFHVLAFNYEGSYDSEGLFSFENCIDNVGVAINFLQDEDNRKKFNIDTSRIVICGYSFGGAIALTSAIQNRKIKYIVSIAGPDQSLTIRKSGTDPEFRKLYYNNVAKSFEPNGPFRGNINEIFERNLVIVNQLDPILNAEVLKTRKILMIVGWQDNLCPLEINALPLYRKIRQINPLNTSIAGFEDGHQFVSVRKEIANTIETWINKL